MTDMSKKDSNSRLEEGDDHTGHAAPTDQAAQALAQSLPRTLSPKTLLDLDAALAELKEFANPTLQTEQASTFDVDNRVLREPLLSLLNVPAHDNSAMDGYAISLEDLNARLPLKVTQRIPAGTHGKPIRAGEAARIFTGAPVPVGASAVVAQEDCTALDSDFVQLNSPAQSGQSIRRAGEDIARGVVVVEDGTRLNPASLGIAASLGFGELCVSRVPKVALFSTGDELVMPGDIHPDQMDMGKIYNSNRFFLKALLKRAGCLVTDLGNIADNFEQTKSALQMAAQDHDLILTSGGVSVGEEDHIKPSVIALGVLHQWALNIKPGKPFAYGRINRPQVSRPAENTGDTMHKSGYAHFMGLPGNPVSSYMTFMLLVQPFLAYLQGQKKVQYRHTPMRANFDWPRADGRREFLRVRQNDQGYLDLFDNQSSGVLSSVVWGDGVVDNPPNTAIKRGEWVNFIAFESWLK